LLRALGIGERLAVAADHPADRHLLAALHLQAHLAEGGDRRRHVEHDRRLFLGRNGDCDGICAEQVLGRTPGRQMVVAADREIKPDHVVGERHHGVERRRAGVVAHPRAHPGDACAFRLLDRRHGGKAHDEVADAVVAVDEGGGRPLPHDTDIGTRLDPARLEAPQIERQADHAVGIAAAQIGLDHQIGDNVRVFGPKAGSLEGALDERRQRRRRDARRLG
jgi:hypothetical protein